MNSVLTEKKNRDGVLFNFKNTLFEGTEPTNNIEFNKLQNKKRRLSNLFFSIINYSNATLFEPDSILDILKNYRQILSEKFNTSEDFDKSLKNSTRCLEDSSEIKASLKMLKNNNPESFLVLPLFSSIHTLSAVVRKQDDELKFYAIDKFTTHFTDGLPKSPYAVEFVIKKDVVDKLVDELNKKAFYVDTPEIFDTIEKYSNKKYILNIKHREQKLFTCLYKEPEAGIKFAFATRNLSNEDFKKLRSNNSFSQKFRLKWDSDPNSTIDIHKRFLEKLKESNPNINLSSLDNVLNNYISNKLFRREFRKNGNFSKAIEIGFGKTGLTENLSIKDRNSEILKNLNIDSIKQVPALWKIYSPVLTPQENMSLLKTGYNTKIFGTYSYVFSNHDLDKILNSVEKLEKKMPIFARQAKDYHSVVNTVVAYALFEMFIKKNDLSISNTSDKDYNWVVYKIDKAIQAAPYSDKAHLTRGILKLNRAIILHKRNEIDNSASELKGAIQSLDNSYKLNPDSAITKLFLVVALRIAGKSMEADTVAKDVFKNEIKIDSELKISINNKKNHFNCMTKEIEAEVKKEILRYRNLSLTDVKKADY